MNNDKIMDKEPKEKKRRKLEELTKAEYYEVGNKICDILQQTDRKLLLLADKYDINRGDLTMKAAIAFERAVFDSLVRCVNENA